MTNTQSFAARELDILSKSNTDPENRPLVEPFTKEILALCEAFGNSGQSGGSAPFVAGAISGAIKKLMLQEPIFPITGIDDEWVNISDMSGEEKWQNKRGSCIFKSSDNKAYYLDAIVWKEEHGGAYSGRGSTKSGEVFYSRQFIKSFPFTPKIFYIDVIKEILPNDWTQEPFIEWNYYDTKHFKKIGEKLWQTEKYRNIIKDEKQLAKVFKYYDKK